eukprot:m.232894 g.232894  ORF g.232894 m.232894 type:complete len:64 (+) comp15727_c2_seq1:239-430(+)
MVKSREELEEAGISQGSEFHLVIPDGVTEINTEAFYMCIGLTSVTIPNQLAKRPSPNAAGSPQ